MPDLLSTAVSSIQRTINLLRLDGTTDRLALVRRPDGDVHWRHDVFTHDEETGALRWVAYGGRLTVPEVLARAPHCEREILRWTREEVEDGPDIVEVDLFSRDTRCRALALLEAELAGVRRAA
jgi:hypothetical protein